MTDYTDQTLNKTNYSQDASYIVGTPIGLLLTLTREIDGRLTNYTPVTNNSTDWTQP